MNPLKNLRVIVLLAVLILAIVAINPRPGREGVAIRSVTINSSAAIGGIAPPDPNAQPMEREVITEINGVPIRTMEDYAEALRVIPENSTARIVTNEDVAYPVVITDDIGLTVYQAPRSNIRQGLDLAGGTRVLLEPERRLEPEEMDLLIESMKQRLNVYGLSDILVRQASELPEPLGSGKQFVLVEIAGATEEEVSTLLAQQGKFEAIIGNTTVFRGGDDVRDVCRRPECSGINPRQPCQSDGAVWACGFYFAITISPEAAQRQADATADLAVEGTGTESYLSESLRLLLDDVEVDSLRISSGLRGRAVTDISITGAGVGGSREEALADLQHSMKQLQTVLITGSLPVELEIAKLETTSPLLGAEFVSNALLVGVLAILAVGIVIFLRYRMLKVSLTMVVVMMSEVVIILGMAALIRWNLDLAAIAGIIIAVGTGVDDQIVIVDESVRGDDAGGNWKRRLKRAFFIIMGAWSTTVVAMLPLIGAGAGLLRGFALTTIAGVTIGVLITRPAFAALVRGMLE